MRHLAATALALFAAAATASCSSRQGAPHARALDTVAVGWNPNDLDLGHVATVADVNGRDYVFSDTGLSIVSAGETVASDTSVTMWRAHAQTIPAADGTGSWVVAIDGMGRLFRVHADMSLENVSERYGFGADALLAVVPVDATSVAFALENEMAIQSTSTITRYTYAAMGMPTPAGSPPDSFLASDGARIAIAATDGVHAFDLPMQHPVHYAVDGATRVAFVPAQGGAAQSSRLVVATDHVLYLEDATGSLQFAYDTGADTIHGLITAGNNVWFAAGSELGLITTSSTVETSGLGIDASATLDPSPSGDVWVIAPSGTVQRYSLDPDQQHWLADIYPIAQSTCAACHSPSNLSYGLDLTQYSVWVANRALIDNAVFVTRQMPQPPGTLTDDQRMTIHTWATATMP